MMKVKVTISSAISVEIKDESYRWDDAFIEASGEEIIDLAIILDQYNIAKEVLENWKERCKQAAEEAKEEKDEAKAS